jgi:dihydrofolate synthase/folylpolyglutamate synthase
MNDLTTWLSYLETLHPTTIDLGLERVNAVAKRLKILPFSIPSVIVTGTNGKGSCVMLLEAILAAAGYHVGAYLSPHLLRYNERVRINQQEVADDLLIQAFAEIEAVRDGTSLTYFEFGTLAALLIFKKFALDFVVLEVGLGGRLDAVNIVDAEIAVISSIGLDHTDWLGANRESIALEKAGIMRAKKPAVCGDVQPPDNLLDYAGKIGAPLFLQGRDYCYKQEKKVEFSCGELAITGSDASSSEKNKVWHWSNTQTELLDLPMPKIALANAATVLQVVDLLQMDFPMPLAAIKQGLHSVFLPGRQQELIKDQRRIVLDVAHNPQAATWLSERLAQNPCSGRTIAVFGMLNDKDIIATIQCMLKQIDVWFVATIPGVRGTEAKTLNTALDSLGISAVKEFASVELAFTSAIAESQPNDQIVVFGSFSTVAPIMNMGITV